jgi:heme-degrading monooxygenase HmoA
VIIRVFRPTIHPGKESEFESFLRETAIPLVSRQKGLVAQHVGRPRDPSSTEYVTVWEDVESVRSPVSAGRRR